MAEAGSRKIEFSPKQKKTLIRIIIALVLVVVVAGTFHFIKANRWIELPLGGEEYQ